MMWSPRTLSTFLSEFGLLVHEGRQRGLEYSSPASMEAPSNAPPSGRGGDHPRPLENLGAYYYMGNTKIATMFASHGALGKRRWLRWAIGRAGAMTVYVCADSENSQQSRGENRG